MARARAGRLATDIEGGEGIRNRGNIVQVIGPVVDVRFEPGQLPALFNAIKLTNPSISDKEGDLNGERGPQLGGNTGQALPVRHTLAPPLQMAAPDALVRGMEGHFTG